MPANLPAPSTPQIDFLGRMSVRNQTVAFLDEGQRDELDGILAAVIAKGVTKKLERRAHAFLVLLQELDPTYQFLDFVSCRSSDEERRQLASLIDSSIPQASAYLAPCPPPKPARRMRTRSNSSGTLLASAGIVASSAAAISMTYHTLDSGHAAFWVAVWGIVCGRIVIGAMKRQSRKAGVPVSVSEGALVVLFWAVASILVGTIGGTYHHGHDVTFVAYLSYWGAVWYSRLTLAQEQSSNRHQLR